MSSITKKEYIFLFLLVGFIVSMFGVLYFFNATEWLDNLNPIWQFMILNLGIYAIIFLLIKSIALKRDFFKAARASFGAICGFIAIDVILPEYHVTAAGELIKGGLFGASASDYFFGYLAQSIGFAGFFLFAFTYVVVPITLLVAAAYIEKDLIKSL